MRTNRIRTWITRGAFGFAVIGLVTVSSSAQPAKPKFTYKSLGTLGGASSTAEGLNEAGDVVGVSKLADGTSSPYIYTAAAGMQNFNLMTEGLLDKNNYVQFGPDRTGDGIDDLYLTGDVEGASGVALYDGLTGEGLGYLIHPATSGLTASVYTYLAPDGYIYISSGVTPTGRNTVLRYHASTGAAAGTFVEPNSGGLMGASGMAFGNDLNGDGTPEFFVGGNKSNNVVAYDGVSGAFVREFVPAGSGGMNQPGDLQFHDVDGDGEPEMLVTSRLTNAILIYSASDGSYLGDLVPPTPLPENGQLNQFAFGPDGDIYACDQNRKSGPFDQPNLWRFDGDTGALVGAYMQRSRVRSSAAFVTFDRNGDLFVSSSHTNEVLRYEGPLKANPGQLIDVFVSGIGFLFETAGDINNAGQVVGRGFTIGRIGYLSQVGAYLYTPPASGKEFGTAFDLDLPGNQDEEATAVNDSGDVAGYFLSPTDNRYHAFLWRPETGAVDLGMLAGQDTYATAITPRGAGGNVQISGYARTSSGDRAWRFNTATGSMQNLGLISGGGSGFSRGWDINGQGVVTGSASAGAKQRAFLRTLAGSMSDLGTLGGNQSYGYGINSAQSVVGFSDTTTKLLTNRPQAFLRTSSNGMFALEAQITNLPDAMKLKIRPTRISDNNRIIGPGALDPAGVAFILTPQ